MREMAAVTVFDCDGGELGHRGRGRVRRPAPRPSEVRVELFFGIGWLTALPKESRDPKGAAVN